MDSVESRARELLISAEKDQTNGVLVAVRDSGRPPARFRSLLHHEIQRRGDGAVDLSVHHRCPWGPTVGRGQSPRGAVFQFTLPNAEKKLVNSHRESHQTGKPHEDIVRDASRQLACEGNK